MTVKGRFRRWLWEPLLAQLRQGLSPARLAWTVAVGLALGVYPVLGVTTLLCLGVAQGAKLNQPVIHLVNQAAYPLQLLLLVPFMKLGIALIPGFHLRLGLAEMLRLLAADPLGAIRSLWGASWRGQLAWLLTAPPVAAALALILTPIFRAVARRLEARSA
ncbi:MAG TPA: DUF2062 domain-containing protein [Holophagaceae bacterium]|nr:DUF2062 domain-containing protein [Holophagaceae bacterium]